MPVDKFGRYVSKKREGERTILRDRRGTLKFTSEGDYDIGLKRLRRVGEPQENDDATTKKFVLDKVKEVSCEDVLKKNDEFYTKRIDPLLRKVQEGVSILEPLLTSYQQGQILSLQEIELKLKQQQLRYEETVQNTVSDLTAGFNKELAELKDTFSKFGPLLDSIESAVRRVNARQSLRD